MGGLEVDHELKLGRLQHREICRPGALENLANIEANLAVGLRKINSITHQSAGHSKVAKRIYRRYRIARRQSRQRVAARKEKWIGHYCERRDAVLRDQFEFCLNLAIGARPQDL